MFEVYTKHENMAAIGLQDIHQYIILMHSVFITSLLIERDMQQEALFQLYITQNSVS